MKKNSNGRKPNHVARYTPTPIEERVSLGAKTAHTFILLQVISRTGAGKSALPDTFGCYTNCLK